MSKGNRAAANNRANQMNPNNAAYASSRAGSGQSKVALDNHSNQLNPNNAEFKPPAAAPSFPPPAKASDTGTDK